MIDHGIPKNSTHRVAAGLGIQGVEDLASMKFEAIMLVPKQFWQAILDLRNSYAADNETLWYIPANYA